jgi:hypothetical protein
LGISWLCKRLFPSQEGIYFMHVVICIDLLKTAIRGLEICVADFEKLEL